MVDDNPPRKLRLLVKGKEKVDALFRRRKKAKNVEETGHQEADDFEDDVPILSRIADPAASQSLKLKLKVNTSTSPNGDSAGFVAQAEDDEEVQDDVEADDHERALKTKRRRGITGIDDLKGTQQFESKTVIANNRVIAKQPSEAQSQQFTFDTRDPIPSKSGATFGPQATHVQSTESQLQQAARNAFLDSQPKSNRVPEEHLTSAKSGMTVKQFLDDEHQDSSKRKHLKAATPLTDAEDKQMHSARKPQPQPQSSRGPLDHLKLNSKQPIPPPRLESASPITNISNFVRPRVEVPESVPEIYRSSHHNPGVPAQVFNNSIPDRTEAYLFAQDAEDDESSPSKTIFGDVPVLNHDRKERVPLGARVKHDDEDDIEVADLESSTPRPQKIRRHLRGMTDQSRKDEDRVLQTFYTAPNRLPNAYLYARRNLKRKRPSPSSLATPDYIYQHSGSSTFNIFRNGILLYPELCLLLAAQLPVQTLINLYSISKDFHVIANQRFTTIILNQLTLKAPHAARCYPWRCYERLCQPDPALRAGTESLTVHINKNGISSGSANINIKPAPPPTHAAANSQATHDSTSPPPKPTTIPPVHRKVPTFAYLHMALHREKSLWQIYQLFAAHGVPLPSHPSVRHTPSLISTLHKLWFLLDIPDNPRRIAYTQSGTLFTPHDLSNTLVFIVKLDMLLNDPCGGEKRDGVRKMVLSACDGFDTLVRVLQRRDWRDEVGILRAWTRYGLQLEGESGERAIGGGWVPLGLSAEEHAASQSVFGIPRAEVGLLKREFWGKLTYDSKRKERVVSAAERGYGRKPMYLIRPDQLVLREAVRRGLVFRKQFLRALMSGYVDEDSETFEALPPADYNGGRSPVLEREGEYGLDDVVAGIRALSVEEGGDELLDLGSSKQGSPWTVKHYPPSKREMDVRREEKERVSGFMQAWKEEVRKEQEEERRLRRGFQVLE
ncbi:hypothetical protein OHC33_005542 [Knufia fluminis]|uniref:Uncharacterized protein n=1 Tax=Knufia fluminis TaxID=191047 RepID=A0AAN8EEC0_9EURO|nr:hypothetical protein OHC33_005542 [Knufia fluminis]